MFVDMKIDDQMLGAAPYEDLGQGVDGGVDLGIQNTYSRGRIL